MRFAIDVRLEGRLAAESYELELHVQRVREREAAQEPERRADERLQGEGGCQREP